MLINYAHKFTYIVGANGYNNLQITRSIYFFLKRKVAEDLLNILEEVNKHANQFREKQSWGEGGGGDGTTGKRVHILQTWENN